MRFVDLFAGLGGFHHGLSNSGSFQCVFASEIDQELRDLYNANFNIMPQGDVTKIKESDIPQHEILCAGFPCQPFSSAGKKNGAKCPKSGMLINDVLRIVSHHKPRFVLLENVPSILTIESGHFWDFICKSFESMGYTIDYRIFNTLEFGTPQNRERVYVICFRDAEDQVNFLWPSPNKSSQPVWRNDHFNSLKQKFLERKKKQQLEKWQNFLDHCAPMTMKQLSFVAPEFGATYPKDFSTLTLNEMREFKGSYGQSLSQCSNWAEVYELLPSYTNKKGLIPNWLSSSVNLSRSIYKKNIDFCDTWHKTINKQNNSWQILEWRGLKDNYCIAEHNIQFRASGIRILKTDKIPSLIAMTPTQIPIIGSQMRYLSTFEGAQLQNLHKLKNLPNDTTKAFKAFGNAVNAKMIELIGKQLLLNTNLN